MEIPKDICDMLEGVPMKSSARNMLQLSNLLSDGTVLAHLVHRRYPKMVQLHNYEPSNSKPSKLENWNLLNSKVLSKMRCPVDLDNVELIVTRGKGVNEVLVDTLRDIRSKLNAYEPQYLVLTSPNTTDQRMKAEAMNSAYGKNRKRDDMSIMSTSTVGRAMHRQSSGISPPQRMSRAKDGDASRRPSRLAAGIAASLAGTGEDEILLGSAGRRAEAKKRMSAREKNAKIIRQSKTRQVRLSTQEMDDMFEKITDKLANDLEEHSEKLDRLDSKSRQFDMHMSNLRTANKREMEGTEKRLSVQLRSDNLMPDAVAREPSFGMGRPEFLKAPEMEDGIHNHSFVGMVSPYSNQLQEMDAGDEDMVFSSFVPEPPPPPPSGPPPAHILAKAQKEKAKLEPDEFGCLPEDYEGLDGVEEEPEEEARGSVGDTVDLTNSPTKENTGVGISMNGLSLDVTMEMESQSKGAKQGKTPAGRPSPDTEVARKVRLSISGPSGGGVGAVEKREEKEENEEPKPVDPSPTGVDWCEVLHEEYGKHYYMHHTGVSQWDKPKVGWVQCTDQGTGRVYYVNMDGGASSWTPPVK